MLFLKTRQIILKFVKIKFNFTLDVFVILLIVKIYFYGTIEQWKIFSII